MRLLPSVALAAALLALIPGPVRAATVRGYDPGPPAADSATATARPPDAGAARATPPGATSRSVAVDPNPSAVEHEPAANSGDQSTADAAVGDPLVGNGLGGALCRNAQLASGLSAAAQRNCQTAGTAAASAPVGHYGFDVHIDTGTLGVSSRTLLVAVQTLLLTPLWTLLLWLTNATLSLLEWAFAIDLLDPATMGSVARTLTRHARHADRAVARRAAGAGRDRAALPRDRAPPHGRLGRRGRGHDGDDPRRPVDHHQPRGHRRRDQPRPQPDRAGRRRRGQRRRPELRPRRVRRRPARDLRHRHPGTVVLPGVR